MTLQRKADLCVPCSLPLSYICFYNVHAFPVQLSEHLSVKGLLPIFNFLGSLVEAVPDVAHSLVTQYGETLQQKTQKHFTVILALVYKEKQRCVSMCVFFIFFYMVITSTYSSYQKDDNPYKEISL